VEGFVVAVRKVAVVERRRTPVAALLENEDWLEPVHDYLRGEEVAVAHHGADGEEQQALGQLCGGLLLVA